jgi:hypothetical protein
VAVQQQFNKLQASVYNSIVQEQGTNQTQKTNAESLYNAPADLQALLRTVRKSTVTIECKESQGSGWVIELGSPDPEMDPEGYEFDQEFPFEVITNNHVIEECHDDPTRSVPVGCARQW